MQSSRGGKKEGLGKSPTVIPRRVSVESGRTAAGVRASRYKHRYQHFRFYQRGSGRAEESSHALITIPPPFPSSPLRQRQKCGPPREPRQ